MSDTARGSAAALADYAAAVAARQPAPGGGSVVGVVAALAAALGAMVCRYTPGDAAQETVPALAAALTELDELRRSFLQLADEDAVAYAAFQAASALPRQSAEDKEARRAAMQTALIAATEVPLAVVQGCVHLLQLLRQVEATGNPHVISDSQIGRLLAGAAARGSLLNVRGNVAMLTDPVAVARFQHDTTRLEASIAVLAAAG